MFHLGANLTNIFSRAYSNASLLKTITLGSPQKYHTIVQTTQSNYRGNHHADREICGDVGDNGQSQHRHEV